MELIAFERSLEQAGPPLGLPPLLEALWWAGHGDWAHAHQIAQTIETADAAWVHAYLHRSEGDRFNAEYWYRRAGRAASQLTLAEEWREISAALLVVARPRTMVEG